MVRVYVALAVGQPWFSSSVVEPNMGNERARTTKRMDTIIMIMTVISEKNERKIDTEIVDE